MKTDSRLNHIRLLALGLALSAVLSPAGALAADPAAPSPVGAPTQTAAAAAMTPGTRNGSVPASLGWCGQQAALTPEGEFLYHLLEESTDNDGDRDFLIADQYFTPGRKNREITPADRGTEVQTAGGAELIVSVFPGKENRITELSRALRVFLADHPEVDWLSGLRLKQVTRTYPKAGRTTVVSLELLPGGKDVRDGGPGSEAQIRTRLRDLEEALSAILRQVPEGSSRYETVRSFNRILTRASSYNALPGNYPVSAHDPLTALRGAWGAAGPVCEAYSGAFRLLCLRSGIPCLVVWGRSSADGDAFHSWNCVQMEDGTWYAMDVTWDDPAVGSLWKTQAVSGTESEEFLLVGTETPGRTGLFRETHLPLGCTGMPDLPMPAISRTAWVPAP